MGTSRASIASMQCADGAKHRGNAPSKQSSIQQMRILIDSATYCKHVDAVHTELVSILELLKSAFWPSTPPLGVSVSVSYVVWEYSASIVYEAIPHVRSY
jgi:hypothetical protein